MADAYSRHQQSGIAEVIDPWQKLLGVRNAINESKCIGA